MSLTLRRLLATAALFVSGWPGNAEPQLQTAESPTPTAPRKTLPPVAVEACACQVLLADRYPATIEKEMADAASLGVKPVRIAGLGSIPELGGEGSVFKWVVSARGELFGLRTFGKDLIKHSVATGGQPVCAAGLARFQRGLLLIDHKSGHYHPDESRLSLAKPRFEAAGFKVQIVGIGLLEKALER